MSGPVGLWPAHDRRRRPDLRRVDTRRVDPRRVRTRRVDPRRADVRRADTRSAPHIPARPRARRTADAATAVHGQARVGTTPQGPRAELPSRPARPPSATPGPPPRPITGWAAGDPTAPLGSPRSSGPSPAVPPYGRRRRFLLPAPGILPPGAIGFPRGSRREPNPDDRCERTRPAHRRQVARRCPSRPPCGARRAPAPERHGRAGAAPARRRSARGVRRWRGPPARQGARRGAVLWARSRAVSGLPARRSLRGARRHRRRPLPLVADARRGRPAPHLRGSPRAPLGRPRRPRPLLRHPYGHRHRHDLRRVGAHGAGRAGHGRFRRLDRRAHPMRVLGSSGVWELFVPGVGSGTRYKFQILGADGRWREKADPLAFRTEIPPATASVVEVPAHEWADDAWINARAQGKPHAEPMSIYEVHLGSWRAGLELSGARRAARRLRRRDRLHPRRAAAGGRAPVRRVVGLPGHVVLRADRPFRHPRRLPLVRRHAAPARHRRDRRLGACALPAGTSGRSRGSTAPPLYEHADPRRGEHPDWGTLVFNFGRKRGAQLPRRQRALLARGVPHRRPARRRRRLDALPRLLPRRGAVAAQRLRRPREPRRRRVPAGAQRDRLRRRARVS